MDCVITARRKRKILFPGSFLYWEILLNPPGTQKGILWGLALAGTMKIFYNKTGVRGKGIP